MLQSETLEFPTRRFPLFVIRAQSFSTTEASKRLEITNYSCRLRPRRPGLHLFPIAQGVCGLRSCARPLTSGGVYCVERIIGRRTLRSPQEPGVFAEEFLVKWEGERNHSPSMLGHTNLGLLGYHANEATWKRKHDIGDLFDKFRRAFEVQAQDEQSQSHSDLTIYLQEALDAGWN